MDHYDEFGNYIGPELDNDSDLDNFDEEAEPEDEEQYALTHRDEREMDVEVENRIILHEDKKYYPDASEVYPGVKTVTLDEDAQDLTEPIIKPVKPKAFSVLVKEAPNLNYDLEFLGGMLQTPVLTRNVALLGHVHHGKTSFLDTLVQATHSDEWDVRTHMRYTDTRKDEQERAISIKSTPMTLLLSDLKDKSFLLNVIDTPGHTNFSDEATAAMRTVDGAVIVVDAVEGVMLSTERLLQEAVLNQLDVCLVITKVDRLILELKLPPQDAYFKLLHTIEQCNSVLGTAVKKQSEHFVRPNDCRYTLNNMPRLSPELGNVCFASGQHNWSFTLPSFAALCISRSPAFAGVAVEDLAKRLWGDWYIHTPSNRLTKIKKGVDSNVHVRSFVHFVLEPLYKIYAQVLGETADDLTTIFRSLGIKLVGKEYHNDPRALLKMSLLRFFGPPNGFVTMIARCISSPVEAAGRIVEQFYTGPRGEIFQQMVACDASGPLMAHVSKLYSSPDGNTFYALARIYSGTLSVGQRVKVLGESFTADDDEDMGVAEVTAIAVPMGRFQHEITSAIAGNIVLLSGVDQFIKKTGTITTLDDAAIFSPLVHSNRPTVKLAIEPFNPAELPKLVEGLRKISKSYPLAATKVEESGEHIILGTGELQMDCIMHDLRMLYTDIEIKVADPVVSFCETVVDSSILNCLAETANKRNRLTVLAEPLEETLAQDIDHRYIDLISHPQKETSAYFKKHYGFDALTAHNIWAFGPTDHDPNLLVNNSLPSEVDQKLLFSVKESIIQGFKWGVREGPLCDEPMRNVKFRLLGADLASEAIHRGGGQVIPAMRRGVYSSFLLASPRLLEPVYLTEIQAPADCVQAIYPVLSRRRGHIVQDTPKPGTPFYTIKAYIPVIDSFGFETDLRSYTLGQVFCQQVFDHWAVVPGDPLDRSVILHPLEPSPPPALARDFMVKTRRRKGLTEDVSVNKYLDDAMLLRLAKYEEQQSGSMVMN